MGLKGRTMVKFLIALTMTHLVRGVSTEALEDTLSKLLCAEP